MSYKPFLRFWAGWSVFTSGTDAWAFLFTDFVGSGAYEYAREIAPHPVWGLGQLVIMGCMLSALIAGKDGALRAGLFLQAMIHLVFGLSILGLTIEGSVAAISGATKWWAYVAVPLFLLSHPFRDERVAIHGSEH